MVLLPAWPGRARADEETPPPAAEATPTEVAVEPGLPRWRARLGGGYLRTSRKDLLENDVSHAFHGLALAGEVGLRVGMPAPERAAVYVVASAALAPSTTMVEGSGTPDEVGEGEDAIALLVGPSLALRPEGSALVVDITVGAAFLSHDFLIHPPGRPSSGFRQDVTSFGLGYGLGATYDFPVGAWRVGPSLQWRDIVVGDVLPDAFRTSDGGATNRASTLVVGVAIGRAGRDATQPAR